MQVSPIKKSNLSYGMSLKINPNLEKKLGEQSYDYLKNIQKVGEDISNVKSYHVILADELYPKVKKAHMQDSKDYFKELKDEESVLGKYCSVTCGDETHGFFNPNEPSIFRYLYKNQAAEKYNEFKQLDALNQAAELSKMLEANDLLMIEKQQKESLLLNTKTQEKKEIDGKKQALIKNLFKNFSTMF